MVLPVGLGPFVVQGLERYKEGGLIERVLSIVRLPTLSLEQTSDVPITPGVSVTSISMTMIGVSLVFAWSGEAPFKFTVILKPHMVVDSPSWSNDSE